MGAELKPIRVTAAIAKRAKRSDYTQGRHGSCVVCKKDFDTCPHSFRQVSEAIDAVRMAESLGIELP